MMMKEFEQRTGFLPSLLLYEVIEKYYTNFDGDKALFCKAYLENFDGLASKIQHEADIKDINAKRETERVIEDLHTQIAALEKALEREQEWKVSIALKSVERSERMLLMRKAYRRLVVKKVTRCL